MNTNVDLKQLVDCIGDAIVVVDAHEKIVMWNPAATRIFGYSEEEALGSTLDLIVPERQRHRHNEGCRKSMETGVTRYGASLLKVPALHKNGSMLSIAFTVGMLFDENQKVNGIVALIRDETERYAQERALKLRISDLEKSHSYSHIGLRKR
jgi:PAS domain S-box-containing protein